MNDKTIYLNRIDEPVNSSKDKFLALAGDGMPGTKPAAGLKMGVSYKTQFRAPDIRTIYMDVVKSMRMDGTYSGFYGVDSSQNERFTSMTEAIRRYNEVVMENLESSEIASQYLIKNIPEEAMEMTEGWINGQGWKAKPQLCTIMHVRVSQEEPENHIVLLEKDGRFAVVEGVKKDEKFGKLDLRSGVTPRFEFESVQGALDVYAEKTKGNKETSHTNNGGKLEPTKEVIKGLTSPVSIPGINVKAAEIREGQNEPIQTNEGECK
jgi:hypothetical protein